MQGANLDNAIIEGTSFVGARLQGALIGVSQSDLPAILECASLRGAALKDVFLSDLVARLRPFFRDIFADGTVYLMEDTRPAHWSDEMLQDDEFEKEWHRVMREHFGMDPENPE